MRISGGFDSLVIRHGIVYIGDMYKLTALYPAPMITMAKSACLGESSDIPKFIFMENDFDYKMRVRRGQFYKFTDGQSSDFRCKPENVMNGLYGPLMGLCVGDFDYEGYGKAVHLSNTINTKDGLVQLGDGTSVSYWTILDVEMDIFGHHVFTLRAKSMMGILPNIKPVLTNKAGDSVTDKDRHVAYNALSRLADTYLSPNPLSTIDAARETTRVILAIWIGHLSRKKDLNALISLVTDQPILQNASFIVGRLHARGKSAEQENQADRGHVIVEPTDDDARISTELVGMIVREIGWASD